MKLKQLLTEKVIIDINKGDWDNKTKTFSFELSDKPNAHATDEVYLRSPSGNIVKFKRYKIDYDASHEDIYG